MCGGRHRREDRNGARSNGWPRFPKFWQSRLRLLGDDKDDEKLSRTPNLPFSDTAAAHHSAHSAPDRQKKIQVPRFDVRVMTVARDYGCLQVVYRKDSAGRLPRPGETTHVKTGVADPWELSHSASNLCSMTNRYHLKENTRENNTSVQRLHLVMLSTSGIDFLWSTTVAGGAKTTQLGATAGHERTADAILGYFM